MSRRRLSPPLIPGFWLIVVFVLLVGSVGGYFYLLARQTTFERQAVSSEP
jgi:hypothetical protein